MGDKALKIDFSAIGTQADMDGVINRITALHRKAIDEARRGTGLAAGRGGLEARPTVRGRHGSAAFAQKQPSRLC